jgi:hypothetical protein
MHQITGTLCKYSKLKAPATEVRHFYFAVQLDISIHGPITDFCTHTATMAASSAYSNSSMTNTRETISLHVFHILLRGSFHPSILEQGPTQKTRSNETRRRWYLVLFGGITKREAGIPALLKKIGRKSCSPCKCPERCQDRSQLFLNLDARLWGCQEARNS